MAIPAEALAALRAMGFDDAASALGAHARGDLTPDDAAQLIGCCIRTLRGLDIPRQRVGGRIFYRREDVDGWLGAKPVGNGVVVARRRAKGGAVRR